MQSTTVCVLAIVLLTSAVTSSYPGSAKLRRDGVLSLYPFPRVGRASHTWQLTDILTEPVPIKKQLYAFPRVGRSGLSQSHQEFRMTPELEELFFGRRNPYVKRQGLSEQMEMKDTPGMWFGPRLGRAYRKDEEDTTKSEAEKSEAEQIETTFTDRETSEA